MKTVLARGKILVELEKTKIGEPLVGSIVAFGKGRQLESGRETDVGFSMEIGLRLLLKGGGGTIEHEGTTYNIVDYSDVMGAVPKAPPTHTSVTNPRVQDPPKVTLPLPDKAVAKVGA